MATRIRYDKSNSEMWRGPIFNVGAQTFGLILFPKLLKYDILIPGNMEDRIIKSDFANSVPLLQKKAKATLKELGVKFDDEIRNNGKNTKLTF